MTYSPEILKTEAFISGNTQLYDLVKINPDLRMVPIAHLETVRQGLQQLGYCIRIRYRGPHGPRGDTLKSTARAFTVYFELDR